MSFGLNPSNSTGLRGVEVFANAVGEIALAARAAKLAFACKERIFKVHLNEYK